MNIRHKIKLAHQSLLIFSVILVMVVLSGCSVTSPPTAPLNPSPSSSATPTITLATPYLSPTISLTVPSSPSLTVTAPVILPTTPALSISPTLASPPPSTDAAAVYTPSATPFKPAGALNDLFQYMLGLINQDRQQNGLEPVALNYNAAAQMHAQDMFDNFFLSHWGTDGLKPYMRYTRQGGLNYELENSAYSGWYDKTQNPANYAPIDPKQELKTLEADMMAEVPPNDGHRQSILNKWNTGVNLGIAYDKYRITLVQQFEGDYVEYFQPPALSGNILSLSGRFLQPIDELNNIMVSYDAPPQPLTQAQLLAEPHFYTLGNTVGNILPPPPPGQIYASLPSTGIIATRWDLDPSGNFSFQADISPALASGPGVYTLVMVVKIGGEVKNLTNYSLFVN